MPHAPELCHLPVICGIAVSLPLLWVAFHGEGSSDQRSGITVPGHKTQQGSSCLVGTQEHSRYKSPAKALMISTCGFQELVVSWQSSKRSTGVCPLRGIVSLALSGWVFPSQETSNRALQGVLEHFLRGFPEESKTSQGHPSPSQSPDQTCRFSSVHRTSSSCGYSLENLLIMNLEPSWLHPQFSLFPLATASPTTTMNSFIVQPFFWHCLNPPDIWMPVIHPPQPGLTH